MPRSAPKVSKFNWLQYSMADFNWVKKYPSYDIIWEWLENSSMKLYQNNMYYMLEINLLGAALIST